MPDIRAPNADDDDSQDRRNTYSEAFSQIAKEVEIHPRLPAESPNSSKPSPDSGIASSAGLQVPGSASSRIASAGSSLPISADVSTNGSARTISPAAPSSTDTGRQTHPPPGSGDRPTPPQPTDRSVHGSNPESKPISVERQQGTESKSVGYPVEHGKSNPNASVEPNRPFVTGDEVLQKRAQGMPVQNPEPNQFQNRPTGLDSGNFKTGGPNNRADSGAGKAESEPQRHDKAESLQTRLEKPDYRTATAPIGLRGEELLDYGLRRPTATTASGTIDGKAEPQHKQQQAFPNSDLKVAGSDKPVKRTDPSENGHFVSDAGGKSVGGDKPLSELDVTKGKATQRPEMVKLPEGSRGADGPLAAIIKQPRGMRGVLDQLEQLNGKLQPGFKIDRGENGVKSEGGKFGHGPKISGIAVVADLTERMKGWRKRPDIDSIDVPDAKPIGGKSARRPQWNAADDKTGPGTDGKLQAGKPQTGKPFIGLDGKLQPTSKSDPGAKGEFGSGPRFTVSAFGFRPEKPDGGKDLGERRAKDSGGAKKQSTESDTRVPLPGKGGVAGVIAGGIESIKEGFRFVRDSLVGSITDRSGTGKGMRTEVFLGFAGRSPQRPADAILKVPPEIKSKLPSPGGSVNVPGLVAVLLPFGGRGIRVTSDVSIGANEELRPPGKSKPSQGHKPESSEAGSMPLAPKSPLETVAPSTAAAGSGGAGQVAPESGAGEDEKTVFSLTKPDLSLDLDESVPVRKPFIRLHLPDGTYGGKSVDKSHKVPAVESKPAQESETIALPAVSKSQTAAVPPASTSEAAALPPALESETAALPPTLESETASLPTGSKPVGSEDSEATKGRAKRYVNPAFDELEETWSSDDDEERDSGLRSADAGDQSPPDSSVHGSQPLVHQVNNYLYLVKPGDSVESVARLELKDPALAPLVFRKNKQHVLPEVEYGVHPLAPGVYIELPTPTEVAEFRHAVD